MNGMSRVTIATVLYGEVKAQRIYGRALSTSEAVGNFRAGHCPWLYTLLKIELLTVPVLSEKDSCSIPIERRMLRCTFDMRVSPFRQ